VYTLGSEIEDPTYFLFNDYVEISQNLYLSGIDLLRIDARFIQPLMVVSRDISGHDDSGWVYTATLKRTEILEVPGWLTGTPRVKGNATAVHPGTETTLKEPFVIVAGATLRVEIDGSGNQDIVFSVAPPLVEMTAAEVVALINLTLTGGLAQVGEDTDDPTVVITSDSTGRNATIEIKDFPGPAADANKNLGFYQKTWGADTAIYGGDDLGAIIAPDAALTEADEDLPLRITGSAIPGNNNINHLAAILSPTRAILRDPIATDGVGFNAEIVPSLWTSQIYIDSDKVFERAAASDETVVTDDIAVNVSKTLGGGENTWDLLTPLTPEPDGRRAHGMCYDPVRDEIILYGGRDIANNIVDTTWGFKSGVWAQKSPTNTPGTYLSAVGLSKIDLIWDPINQVILLFGGTTTGIGVGSVNSLFSWNGTDWFQEIADGASGDPHVRSNYGICFDEERSQIVLFSGDVSGGTPADTWLCDVVAAAPGSRYTWQVEATPATSPGWRGGHRMGYNPNTKTCFMMGGGSLSPSAYLDTWEWTGDNWIERIAHPDLNLTGTWSTPAFMYINNELVILGRNSGVNGDGRMELRRWIDSLSTWDIIPVLPEWIWDTFNFYDPPPFPRGNHAAAWDSAGGQLMMFGGKSTLFGGPAITETWTISLVTHNVRFRLQLLEV
jgi:hypothetical protein